MSVTVRPPSEEIDEVGRPRPMVFISHAAADRELVRREIVDLLKDNGVDYWYAETDILPTKEWEVSIRQGLERCNWFLVVMTPRSALSDWVRWEVHWAFEEKQRVIPVLLEPCDKKSWDLRLQALQYVPFYPDRARGRTLLLTLLGLSPQPCSTVFAPAPPNPDTTAAAPQSGVLGEARQSKVSGADDSDLRVVREAWGTAGPTAALAAAEQFAASADEAKLIGLMRLLSDRAEPAGTPLIFRFLAHPSERLRRAAQAALQSVGWPRAVAVALDCARGADLAHHGWLLDGLTALEAHAESVALLDRLTRVLRGDLRNRAILLLERKRLALTLEATAALFREHQSPYRLIRVLGQGLYAAAYLARHDDTDMNVVVRVLLPEFTRRTQVRDEFLELGRRAARLVHQNLVRTVETRAIDERDLYYTVRDYIEAPTLQRLHDQRRVFTLVEVLAIMRQTLDALSPAHRQGIAHGGVKPSNLFMCPDGRLILGDPSLPPQVGLDLARLAYDYRYTAPETFRGGPIPKSRPSMEPASDLYSLGCVTYELICGEPPFVSDNPFELAGMHLRDPIPPLDAPGVEVGSVGFGVLMQLLAKEPVKRFASLAEALAAVESWAKMLSPRKGASDEPPPTPVRAEEQSPSDQFVPPRHVPLLPYGTLNSIVPAKQLQGGTPLPRAQDTPFPQEKPPAQPVTLDRAAGSSSLSPMSDPANGLPGGAGAEAIPGYEILGVLGHGGMGIVYKARQINADRLVALKMILAGGHARPEEMARFRTEAEAIARLQHPHIVQVFEVGEHNGLPFFSLEFCPGGSLDQKLAGMPLPPQEAAALVAKLAQGVQAAHAARVLHRDLKPANVLLAADGTPKVIDFGLAKKLDARGVTLPGSVMGTPSYMAPEQAGGAGQELGPAVDVYALGAILYECLTGRPPFRAATVLDTMRQVVSEEPVPPRQLNAQVPRDLETVCLKCLQKEPGKRYDSAQALADDLQRFLRQEPILARPATRRERLAKWCRRNPMVVLLLVLAALLLGTTLTATALLYKSAIEARQNQNP
jgi:serine/threonine protein kinase